MSIATMPHLNGDQPFSDFADSPKASHWPSPAEDPRKEEFLRKFCDAYDINMADSLELEEWVQVKAAQMWTEKFHQLLAVFHDCKIPSTAVFAAIIRNEGEKLRDTGAHCQVSQTAVYKHVLWQQEVLKVYKIRNTYARFGKENKQWYTFNDNCEVRLLKSLMALSANFRRVLKHGLMQSDNQIKQTLLDMVKKMLLQLEKYLERQPCKS